MSAEPIDSDPAAAPSDAAGANHRAAADGTSAPDGTSASDGTSDARGSAAAGGAIGAARARLGAHEDGPRLHTGGYTLDGVSSFMGLRWEDPQTLRMRIRPELINGAGLLSGVATYAMVDYCMGSTLWVQTTPQEHIATISIAINYVQTATEGEVVCRTTLDRRNRTTAVMRSEVHHEDGRLLVTAIGSFAIFPARPRKGGCAGEEQLGAGPATSPNS